MAYKLRYSDYPGTDTGPPDPERWVGPPGPPGPVGPMPPGGPFLPLSGNATVTGPVTFNGQLTAMGSDSYTTASDMGPGSARTFAQTIASGVIGPNAGAPFTWRVLNQGVDGSTSQGMWHSTFIHNFASTRGGLGGIRSVMFQTAATADASGSGFFVNPLEAYLDLEYPPGTGSYGNGIAFAAQVYLGAGASGWSYATGQEIAVTLAGSSSVSQAYLTSYIWNATSHPTAMDAANCFIASGGNAIGMRSIWQLGRNDSQWPLDPNGWLLTTVQQVNNNPGNTQRWAQACAGGLDFSKINFSTAALRTSGITLGNTAATVGTGRLSEDANGLVVDATGQVGAISSVSTGGSGYVVNDQLYDGYGGIMLVTAVSGGAITAAAYITARAPNIFAAPPANPLATTGGTGSGATVNVTWTARSGLSLNPTGQRIGFNGTAPVAKPTVTGSKGANAALASLLSALASYGLVLDSST